MGLWCDLFVDDIKLTIALKIGFDCGIVDNKEGHSVLLENGNYFPFIWTNCRIFVYSFKIDNFTTEVEKCLFLIKLSQGETD